MYLDIVWNTKLLGGDEGLPPNASRNLSIGKLYICPLLYRVEWCWAKEGGDSLCFLLDWIGQYFLLFLQQEVTVSKIFSQQRFGWQGPQWESSNLRYCCKQGIDLTSAYTFMQKMLIQVAWLLNFLAKISYCALHCPLRIANRGPFKNVSETRWSTWWIQGQIKWRQSSQYW